MSTYLFTWNPKKWDWKDLDSDVDFYRKHRFLDCRWSCGVTKKIVPGDRVFLIRLGDVQPVGIMASGNSISTTYEDEHFSEPNKMARYSDLRLDVMIHPKNEKILLKQDLQNKIPEIHWTPQASGMLIAAEAAIKLEELWNSHLNSIGLSPVILSDEIVTPEKYFEGAVRTISVNAYERDPRAREACISFHGNNCVACGFNFESIFGALGKGYIHVHHLTPISEIGETYEVNPKIDLVPVCPNCHAMLHQQRPPLMIEDLKSKIQANKNTTTNRDTQDG